MSTDLLRHRSRGAALAETAVVVSFTLLLLFGMLQIVLIGYLQVAGDSAVFIAAHEYTLGVPQTTIANAEASMVPGIVASAITYTPAPPPSVNPSPIDTMYGTINQEDRNGGYTIVRPQNFQVYLNGAAYSGILGFNNLPISSGAVEAYYLMSNDVMDNSGAGPNDLSYLGGNILNPGSASPFLPSTDTAANNMNVPPYYSPTTETQFCTDPWTDQTTAGYNGAFGDTCTNPENWSLGIAEYLDNNNYSIANMGVGYGTTFQAMAAHQRIYADLIDAFPPMTTSTQLTDFQTEMENYDASETGDSVPGCGKGPVTGYCGMNWQPADDSNFSGVTGYTSATLAYYDPLLYQRYNGTSLPNWMTRNYKNLFAGESASTLQSDAGSDGPEGPWNGASFALVYEWDQPNAPNTPIGPGEYPYNPLAGSESSGDPGY